MRFRLALALLLAAPAFGVPIPERAALTALYRSTGGEAWRDRSGWLGRPGTECRWHGVVCNAGESAVVELRLASNGLAGSLPGGIPPELAGLARLRVLDLRSNALEGSIPAELGRISGLEILDLAYNGLTGEIPRGLGRLGLLRVLSLEHNALTGVSTGLGRLASLTTLDLSFNPIAELPDDLARLERLRSLRLRDGLLPEIPAAVLALRSLETLDLSGNPMAQNPGAGLSEEIGDLERLVRLSCDGCGLTGPVPAGIARLSRLDELDLGNNAFDSLPDLGALQRLRVLRLAWNRLESDIPDVAGLSSLETLDLSGNPFTPGPVPESWRGLQRLRELELRGTGRTGEIPAWLPELDRLAWLDLAENAFDPGPVPPFFRDMTRLRRLVLDRTNRTGTLPDWIGRMGLTLLSIRDNAFDPGPLPVFLASTRIGHVDLSGTERIGALVPLVAANAWLRVLRLDRNHLLGSIPPEWGRFPSLEILGLSGNRLAGPIPREMLRLGRLLDGGGLDLRWNGLTAADPDLAAWLDAKAGDWRSTQTLAPRGLAAVLAGPDRVHLSWSPSRYRAEGGYDVLHATSPEGPFTRIASTDGKLATSVDIEGLAARTRHWFRVRAATDPHPDNPNRVTSLPGPAVDVVTLPPEAE
jgi:Leucine-rich repeat (LRR) protein